MLTYVGGRFLMNHRVLTYLYDKVVSAFAVHGYEQDNLSHLTSFQLCRDQTILLGEGFEAQATALKPDHLV